MCITIFLFLLGGIDKFGEIIALVNFSPDTDRDAAEISWGNGYTNVYRLGYHGRLDVISVEPIKGKPYYRDHLPNLSKYKAVIHIWVPPNLESAGGGGGGEEDI